MFGVPTYDLVYAPVPKTGCTSLKRALYRLEHGVDYAGTAPDGTEATLHEAFPSHPFDARDFAQVETPWLFAVVRDPAERVLSTWSERVMGTGRLEQVNARREGTGITRILRRVTGGTGAANVLDPRPTLDQFVLNLDHYADAYPGAVGHHVQSVDWFLGPDLSIYDRIYRLDEMEQLQTDLRDRTGQADFTIGRNNASPEAYKATLDDLSDIAFDTLMTRLAPEYDLLKDWFERPRRDNRNTQQTGTI